MGLEMDNTETNLEKKESSTLCDSNKGFCSDSLCRADEQNLVEQRAGETPLTGEEHLSTGGGETSCGEYHFLYSD
jgi:hypothetical protein